MAIEQPAYKVVFAEPPFQIRDYGPVIVASVHVAGARSHAVNAGFRILAGYIFGANRRKDKIAMTAPVSQSVASLGDDPKDWEVRFTMPASATLDALPAPDDSRIRLIPTPARRMAVISFSGLWTDANFGRRRAQLQAFLKQRGTTATSEPVYAYYDPPWTPWFLRTNEVQMELAPR